MITAMFLNAAYRFHVTGASSNKVVGALIAAFAMCIIVASSAAEEKNR